MRAPLAILLPPSEGKAEGGAGMPWSPDDGFFGGSLAVRRAEVVAALHAAAGGDERLLGVGRAHLVRARQVNSALLGAPTMPAGQRYTGVVWDHLRPRSLPPAARRRARESVVVVSALLGVAMIDDPVPDHRLKMGASLSPLGRLSSWWREPLSAALNEWLAGRFVVDLLTTEHRGAWTPSPGRYAGGAAVTFVARDGGRVAGHDAKAAKGRLARHLLMSRASAAAALRTWEDDRFAVHLQPF